MAGKKRPAEAAAAPAGPSQEESFPRGGGDGLSALEHRRTRLEAEAAADRDFFSEHQRSKGKRVKTSGLQEAGEEQLLFKQSGPGQKQKYVELLKFKALTPGSRIWGCIASIFRRSLVVSLPHGLRGQVSIEEASDYLGDLFERKGAEQAEAEAPHLSQLFDVGQMVRCTVTEVGRGSERIGMQAAQQMQGVDDLPGKGKKHVGLSLRARRLHSGLTAASLEEGMGLTACVSSVEDHGYILNLGIKGTTAFLAKDDAGAAKAGGFMLQTGAVIECVVVSAKDRRLVHVTADPAAVSSAITKEWNGMTIGSLLPGALVNIRVQALLSDGLAVSFLSFFNGTIDIFHLSQVVPKKDWAAAYSPNQRMRARILFVDPLEKRVCLSLLPHLLAFSLPASPPQPSTLLEDVTVARVDPGLGVLLEAAKAIPPTAGYAHISQLADERVEKADKKFRPGQMVKARVLGSRPMDGLATFTLQPSAVNAQFATAAEAAPGAIVSGTIMSVEEYGLLVSLTQTIRALVPNIHVSDTAAGGKVKARFKAGQKVTGRILDNDLAAKRISMTLKKSLISSKLPALTTLQDAMPGVRSHGVVTGVQDYGLFVSFFGGVSGLAHSSQLGLAPEQNPTEAFKVGEVVKARVISADPASRRLSLSLVPAKQAALASPPDEVQTAAPSPAPSKASSKPVKVTKGPTDNEVAIDPLGGLQPGDIVQGQVVQQQTQAVGAVPTWLLRVQAGDGMPLAHAVLSQHHLSDHPAGANALEPCLAAGTALGPLLVLERLEAQGLLSVTRKASLVTAASRMPIEVESLQEHMLLPGYIANIVDDACFVSFLNRLTGRAGLPHLSDTFVSDPRQHFSIGQSVLAQVLQVDREKRRFSVSLRPSLCGTNDGAFAKSLFDDLELAASLKSQQEGQQGGTISALIPIGSLVKGSVSDVKPYGLVCDLDPDPDVVGFVAGHQQGSFKSATAGTDIQARVLDVNHIDGIVDLSLSARFLAKQACSPSGIPEVGTKVRAVVELVKEEYLVLSLPGHGEALGFAALKDYNCQQQELRQRYPVGMSIPAATIAQLPSASTGNRLLLSIPLASQAASRMPGGGHGEKRKREEEIGTLVSCEVTAVKSTHLDVSTSTGNVGSINITEMEDPESAAPTASPFAPLSKGSVLEAVVVGCRAGQDLGSLMEAKGRPKNPVKAVKMMRKLRFGSRGMERLTSVRLQLSARPSVIQQAKAGQPLTRTPLEWSDVSAGQSLTGYITKVEGEMMWVSFSEHVRGRLHALDTSSDLQQLVDWEKRLPLGSCVGCTVAQVDTSARQIELVMENGYDGKTSSEAAQHAAEGQLVTGFIISVAGSGVLVALGADIAGRVPLTEIHDALVPNAVEGLKPGQAVRASVLQAANNTGPSKKAGRHQLLLSLRSSKGGAVAGLKKLKAALPEDAAVPVSLQASDLSANQQVHGYVKNVTAKGVFVALASNLDAHIKLANLADGYVEKPADAFPEGLHVAGRVLSVVGSRVELTLKTKKATRLGSVEEVPEGALVRGTVKRVEPYGVFVALEGSTLSGLAHVSQISDTFVKNIKDLFSVGQEVKAKVLAVDAQKQRLSLGLAPHHIAEADASLLADGGASADADSASGSDLDDDLAAGLLNQTADGLHEGGAVVIGAYGNNSDDEVMVAADSDDDGGADAGLMAKLQQELLAEQAAGATSSDDSEDLVEEAAAEAADQSDDDLDTAMAEVTTAAYTPLQQQSTAAAAAAAVSAVEPSSKKARKAAAVKEAALHEAAAAAAPSPTAAATLTKKSKRKRDDPHATLLADIRSPVANGSAPAAQQASRPMGLRAVGWGDEEEEVDPREAAAAAAETPAPAEPVSKSKRKRQKAQQEAEVRAAELKRMEGASEPASEEDYERLILATPNSSFVWVKFMAWLISLGEVQRARDAAERALNTIHFREEGEKFNVWVAWLNLENLYGEPAEEAVMGLFRRALAANPQKALYMALINILERSQKAELSAQVLRTACKKFAESAKVWLAHIRHLLVSGDGEAIQNVLNRALAALPRRKHIKLLTHTALAEFKLGSPERGRNIYEGVLRSYPKRLDIWSQYLDQEIARGGDRDRTRMLFERAVHLSLPPKKMKFIFQRFLDFEKQHGNAASIAAVKSRALEYAEQNLAG